MKVLLDTNIIIDNLARRDEYAESLQILNLCEDGIIEGLVSTVTVMDVMYIMRKHMHLAEAKNAVQLLLQIVGIVPALKGDVNAALAGDFPDFEDAVQASCVVRIKADYIITRNTDDYKKSIVPAILPENFLLLMDAV